jgi:hypothetical protein
MSDDKKNKEKNNPKTPDLSNPSNSKRQEFSDQTPKKTKKEK